MASPSTAQIAEQLAAIESMAESLGILVVLHNDLINKLDEVSKDIEDVVRAVGELRRLDSRIP